MAFHGVDYREELSGPISVTEVPSGITAMVGIAPKGPVNSLILVNNLTDAAQFGSEVPGFTIPQALATHLAEGGQPVMVVNAFDNVAGVTAVATESVVLTAGKGKTAFPPVSNLVVKHTSGTPIYVKDTDYVADDYGNIRVIGSTILPGATLQVSYNKQNLTYATAAIINGTIDGTTGARTGFKALMDAGNLYGKEPKIIIAPGFSQLGAVGSEMIYWANYFLGMAIIDMAVGTTATAAKAARGPAGTSNYSNERAIVAFPWQKSYDPATDTYIAKPFSQFLSGVIGRVDTDNGFHWSPDNKELRTSKGTDVSMTSSAVHPDTDAQNLIDLGVVTILNEGSSGMRVWGSRSSAYPGTSAITTFIPVRRTVDILTRSIQLSSIPFIGRPMLQSLRNAIRETGNGYIRSLISRGALIDGEVIYDPAKNPISQTSAGHWVFTVRQCPPPPLDRLTYDIFTDITYLENLNANL